MNLLVDIGNTRTKFINSEQLGKCSSVIIDNNLVNGEWLEENWSSYQLIILSSVSDKPIVSLINTWAKIKNIDVNFVQSEASRFGLTSYYEAPEDLGVDRWLAMLGAITVYPKQNVLIVDSGTATTIDLVNDQGKHRGGWIMPGIQLMFDSLLANTSKVNAAFSQELSTEFGNSTTKNVNNACWASTVGLIEMAIKQTHEKSETLDLIILMGGNAINIQSLLSIETVVDHELIFRGLCRYNVN